MNQEPIQHLSDKNVVITRHECFPGRTETEYMTTDGLPPHPDSIAVRSGILSAKSKDAWKELSEGTNRHYIKFEPAQPKP